MATALAVVSTALALAASGVAWLFATLYRWASEDLDRARRPFPVPEWQPTDDEIEQFIEQETR